MRPWSARRKLALITGASLALWWVMVLIVRALTL